MLVTAPHQLSSVTDWDYDLVNTHLAGLTRPWLHAVIVHMQAMIEEMRTGKPYELPKEGMTRSKLAAGPTTLEDLVNSLLAIPIPFTTCTYSM